MLKDPVPRASSGHHTAAQSADAEIATSKVRVRCPFLRRPPPMRKTNRRLNERDHPSRSEKIRRSRR